MIRHRYLAVAISLYAGVAHANADEIDCVTDQWSDADYSEVAHALSSDVANAPVKNSQPPPVVTTTMVNCMKQYDWNDAQTDIAMRYSMIKPLIKLMPAMILDAGGTVSIIDSFYDQNRAQLVLFASDDPRMMALAKIGLKALGYPVDNAKAFDQATAYIGTRIVLDHLRDDFTAGIVRSAGA